MSAEKPNVPILKLAKKARRWRAIRNSWPLLVWLGFVGVAAYTYSRNVQFQRMNGRVQSERINLAPSQMGIIEKILVTVGHEVLHNDEVVVFSSSGINQEIAAEREKIREDLWKQERALFFDIQDSKKDRAEAETLLNVAKAKLPGLERAYKAVKGRLETGLATEDDVYRAQADLDEVIAEIDQYQARFEEMKEPLRKAKTMLTSLQTSIVRLAEGDHQSDKLKLLLLQKDGLVLRAQRNGIISEVIKTEGEVIDQGETVVELSYRTGLADGFIPEENAHHITLGDTLFVASVNNPFDTQKAEVISIAPKIVSVADRASPINDRRVRGRRFTVKLSNPDDLLPGEGVIIHLKRPMGIPLLRWWR